jgi:hypothetical protein
MKTKQRNYNSAEVEQSLDAIIQLQYIGEENRQLPALWTAELEHDKSQIRVCMLSDISGKCFHADKPIQIDVPLKVLSKYGNKLQVCSAFMFLFISTDNKMYLYIIFIDLYFHYHLMLICIVGWCKCHFTCFCYCHRLG